MIKRFAFLLACLVVTDVWAISLDTDAPKTIIADKIEYNVKSETLQTRGKTEIINQSGQRMTLTDTYISQKTGQVAGDDIKLWLGQNVYLESDHISRDGDITTALDATFTACKDCDPYGNAWEIYSTKTIHNMDTRMLQFYNPVLWVYNLPVFWAPYFTMPDPGVKHKTGLLFPYFKSTNKMGTQINIPVYVYLSDTQDMTFTLSYLTRENPLFQMEHRLNMAHSEYRTYGSFTRNRDGENRWHIFNNDVIELGEYIRATVFLERASDKTYLQKYGFYGDQPYLDSGAKVEMFGQSGYIVADAHIFQELRSNVRNYATPSGNILPNIRGTYQTSPLFSETYMTFGGDILGISGDESSQRMIGDIRITSPWTLWGGNRITASLDARYDVYNFNNTEMVNHQRFSGLKNRFLPSGYIEWGLPLMRPSNTWRQIIEPRARLTIMRYLDNPQFVLNNDSAGAFLSDTTLFSNNRFSGLDLWENGTYADYGVRWAAYKSNGPRFEMFLGQTYDFRHRADTDPNSGFHNGASDYVGRIEYNTGRYFNINTRFRFAEQDLSLRHMETSTRLGNSRNWINVGHIWSQQFIDAFTMDDNINEFMAGFGVKLTDRWSMRFNSIYNMTYGQFQRHSGGLFYEHPCYFLSMEYHRDNAHKNDYVGTTTFQFRFGMSVEGKHY